MRRKEGEIDLKYFLALTHLEVMEDQPTFGQVIPKKADCSSLGVIRWLSNRNHLRH
jgi:hypothetical protein